MKRIHVAFALLFLGVMALAFNQPVQASFVQQRDQISIAILVNVTPAPVALRTIPTSDQSARTIVAHISLRGASPAIERVFEAQSLQFEPGSYEVAQTNQKAVKVEAEVSPNPNATLLYSNQNSIVVNAVAGTTVAVPCAYQVTVDTTKTYWQLYDGLSNDFAGSFPGGDLANNTHLSGATPQPTATPFFVYPDNSDRWALRVTSGLQKTYCVDLTLSVPVSVAQGAYSSNAVYTLYY